MISNCKSSETILPENYDVVYGRIRSLSRQFQADRNLLQQYDDILQSQLKQGIIEKVPETKMETNCKKHYLPHHPMVMPCKSTTQVRIVYDTSVKVGRDVKCLNDCLIGDQLLYPICVEFY